MIAWLLTFLTTHQQYTDLKCREMQNPHWHTKMRTGKKVSLSWTMICPKYDTSTNFFLCFIFQYFFMPKMMVQKFFLHLVGNWVNLPFYNNVPIWNRNIEVSYVHDMKDLPYFPWTYHTFSWTYHKLSVWYVCPWPDFQSSCYLLDIIIELRINEFSTGWPFSFAYLQLWR